ncbi:hypothetical protein [Sphingomonas sp. LM7]|uniref:hypothetical protein n=1 Tax=Sphingomonas sp. LM7 TaxID=1938607 RepID=UPI000983BBAD|nr:hypothetical protein [Sphingomonas sp. LM7]AQR74294.1 hypothetical protein BXU08_12100 [Sphingomonas sp. LM7]
MRRIEKLPPAFSRYRKVGGAFTFAAFDGAREGDVDAIEAIRVLLDGNLNSGTLRAIGACQITEAEFLGEHCAAESRKMVKRGTWETADGRRLVDPPLATLDGVAIRSGGYGFPDPGAGGQFARAFASPPYSLDARPSEIQSLFDDILDFLLPPGAPHRILDWTSPRLGEVSPWFNAGMEWWGAFLFTIHQPGRGRLIALAASTTD